MLTHLSSHPWVILGIVFGLFVVLIRFAFAAAAAFRNGYNPRQTAPSAPARYDDQAERDVRFRREQQLWHLKRDLEHAEWLMQLEEQAHALRRRYAARRAPYSSQVEDDLTAILTRIDAFKHNPHSG